jgi:hypothetical protein
VSNGSAVFNWGAYAAGSRFTLEVSNDLKTWAPAPSAQPWPITQRGFILPLSPQDRWLFFRLRIGGL